MYGRIESKNSNYNLIIFGQTGDDIYPILYSYDDKGKIIDSFFLILNGCGGADDEVIPTSFVSIDKNLKITISDTTRFIHYPENSKFTDDYIVDSLSVSQTIKAINKNGKFVTTNNIYKETTR